MLFAVPSSTQEPTTNLLSLPHPLPVPPPPPNSAGFAGAVIDLGATPQVSPIGGGGGGRGRRLLQLNSSDVRVAGHFNLEQRLDSLALEYNMTLTQVTRAFRQWTKQFGKNYTSTEEQARPAAIVFTVARRVGDFWPRALRAPSRVRGRKTWRTTSRAHLRSV